MRFSDLVVIDAASAPGIFTAPQALAWPVAVSLVVTISRAARTMFHLDANSPVVPLVASASIVAAIVWMTVTDARGAPRTTAEWLAALAAATGNGCVVFAAAVGIEKF